MNKDYYFCGIGGSGMMPLALIVQSQGHRISGSDRALDQGRTPEKFDWLRAHGVGLFAQDGSGVTSAEQTVIASGAIEDTVPDIAAAKRVGATILTRPQFLSQLFNASPISVGVAGTSGKSTITGMVAWILHQTGHRPTVVNGAVMKNFVTDDQPFASALVGGNDTFVAEVDESDGSIARYNATVAVVSNISLDHKSMEELRDLFGGFVRRADTAVLNLDNTETAALAQQLADSGETKVRTFTLGEAEADIAARAIQPLADGIRFELVAAGLSRTVTLKVPGAHNVANAIAAIAAANALGVGIDEAATALESFAGIRRRLETVGTSAKGITVIDDFAHNPDKISATLKTLHAFDGRLLVMFQPHGFGPLKLMRQEFIDTFATLLKPDDVLVMPEPVYYGGTTDRSVSSGDIAEGIRQAGRQAEALATRDLCADRIVELAKADDRILVMGARDDTLSSYAADLLKRL
ncbi:MULTISPECIES: glutamate ligase domain-containing protein [unclassified Brevundimonas]|uniref:glutamate ligase domain-containing protein n=1 Tax=unclassified Brevundimonas TaxID=2622653 RepID=UPI0025C235F9|nr:MULTISPECIES: Mur ligase family protein [unclassified Brevundimonas]